MKSNSLPARWCLKVRINAVNEWSCRLGESPVWDHRQDSLFWVDSLVPTVFRWDYATGKTSRWTLPGDTLGSLALRDQGGLLLAMDQGFYLFSPDNGTCELIAEPLAGRGELRLNDGKVDPFGCFISGSMHRDHLQPVDGPAYRVSPDLTVDEILDGFQCFNGPCFSADGRQLYVTGRRLDTIEVFDYSARQPPTNGRPLLENCNPGGATVDAEGYVWSAQWDDECLLRIAPDGSIDRRLEVPGQVVSSVMFGGPELDIIYVTTVGVPTYGASPCGDLAGCTLALTGSGYRGRPEPLFKG